MTIVTVRWLKMRAAAMSVAEMPGSDISSVIRSTYSSRSIWAGRKGFTDLRGFRRVWHFDIQKTCEQGQFEVGVGCWVRPIISSSLQVGSPSSYRVTSGFQCRVSMFEENRCDSLQDCHEEGRKWEMRQDYKRFLPDQRATIIETHLHVSPGNSYIFPLLEPDVAIQPFPTSLIPFPVLFGLSTPTLS